MLRKLALNLALATVVATGPVAADDLSIALVLPGSINDQSANQATYEAVLMAQETIDFEMAFSEGVGQADQSSALSDYARRGYGIVIAMGGEFSETAPRVASRFEDTTFICIYCSPNDAYTSFSFDYEQMGVIFGYLGTMMSPDGKVGFVGGQQVGILVDMVRGMEAGARMAREDGEALVTYTNDWDDVAKAKEATLAQFAQGAVAVGSLLDRAIAGVWQAATEEGKLVMNPIWELADVKPEIALVSIILETGTAITELVGKHQEGTLEKTHYLFGFESPHMRMGRISDVAADHREGVAALVEDLKAGMN